MTIFLTSKSDASIAQHLQIGNTHLITDIGKNDGGEDLGPSPHDLYDAALASCKALTLMWFAKKKGIKLEQIETHIDRDDTDERSGIYRLQTRLLLKGQFDEHEFQQLIAVAEKCPIHKLMTSISTEITTHVEHKK